MAIWPELVLAQTAQGFVQDRSPTISLPGETFVGRLTSPYETRSVSPVSFQNSQRIFDLIRAGQMYLSLRDAIALALENNLDIGLERFTPRIADTDLLRARGGGLPRGWNLSPA